MTDKTSANSGSSDPNVATDDGSGQQELLLSHEYDGIREYDNPMPRWWKWIFWGSFYFSIAYVFHYHIGDGASVAAVYEADVAQAREREAQAMLGNEVTEESLATLMANDKMMKDASMLFIQRCAQCHGDQGEGLIGPNLTDEYWLNTDGSLLGIHDIIAQGVQSKGMPAWNRQLRPIELAKVAAYVGSIRNTNIKGPKGPEGKKLSVGDVNLEGAPPGPSSSASQPNPSESEEAPPASATAPGLADDSR